MPACQPFCGHAKPGNCLATQRVRMHQCGTYPCRFVFVCVEILSFNTFWNIFYCEFIHLYVHEITSFGMVGSIAYPNMWNGRPPITWRTNLFWPDYTELFSTRHIKPVCLGGLSRSIKCCTYASHDFPQEISVWTLAWRVKNAFFFFCDAKVHAWQKGRHGRECCISGGVLSLCSCAAKPMLPSG